MHFYSPLYFISILSLIPLILMYLLKREHKEIILPSNYLWGKTLSNIDTSKPWQKLTNNILLILHIIILILIVLALAKPYIFKGNISGNLIIVLDNSLSMQNRDIDGMSRFEKSKEEIEKIIKDSKENTKITLMTMGHKPHILLSSSNDKKLLKKQLESITAENSRENIKDTLSIVKALIKDANNCDIIFYTDKEIKANMDRLNVNKIKGDAENISIDNMSYAKLEDNIAVLTTVTNHSNKNQKFDIYIYGDKKILDVKEITLKDKETKNIYFNEMPSNITILKSEIDVEDSLDIDNTRYQVVSNTNTKKVLIISNEGSMFLEKAVAINENIEVYKLNEQLETDIEGYDLYIYDGTISQHIPKDGNLFIFNPADNDMFKTYTEYNIGQLEKKEDELLKYVNLDFYIHKTKIIEETNWLKPIITLNNSTVIGKGIKGNQKIIVVGFDLQDTDLPLKADFPIFISNVLDYTLNLNTQQNTEVLAGKSINIDIFPQSKEVYIKNPNEEKQKITNNLYTDTLDSGVYTIEQLTEKGVLQSYFVSNIDTSQIPTEEIEQDKHSIGKNNKNIAMVEKDITNIALLIILTALSFEWVVYNRGY